MNIIRNTLVASIIGFTSTVGADITPETIQDVRDATYKLYLRVAPPGHQDIQTVSFCSASFHRVEEGTWDDEKTDWWNKRQGNLKPGTYGTTAGHCLDSFNVFRSRVENWRYGTEVELVISSNNENRSFITVEPVNHGFSSWREWENNRDELQRPSPDEVSDWGVIRVDEEMPTIPVARLETTEKVYSAGFPMALGMAWATGVATPDFDIPGTIFDGSISSDIASSPGTSGSPIVNSSGEKVGILVAAMTPRVGTGPTLITPIEHVEYHSGRSMGGDLDFNMYEHFSNDLSDFVIEKIEHLLEELE